jgi:serine/threonine protein kinase
MADRLPPLLFFLEGGVGLATGVRERLLAIARPVSLARGGARARLRWLRCDGTLGARAAQYHGMAEPIVGTVLGGKYVVEGILGRGGMGVVVAARHRDLDQRFAIKCLLPHALAIPEVVERFGREARAAARIQGEHVARVLDVGWFQDGTPFMVMEHLRGHDLAAEIAQRGPLPIPDAIRYVLEACEAVAQAHALRIIHRDLKPSNLFLAETPGRPPIVKVLDFGISKVVDPTANALTKTASVMGTPLYMSPEQLLSSKNIDFRSDIWALGVILYELLAGFTPFHAESAPEVIAKIMQNAPPPLRARRPDLPPELEAVVGGCMRSRVEERLPSVADLAIALLPFVPPTHRGSVRVISQVLGVPADVLAASLARVPWAPSSAPDTVQTGPPTAPPTRRGTTERMQSVDGQPRGAVAAVSQISTAAPPTLPAAGAGRDERPRNPGPMTERFLRAAARSRRALWALAGIALCLLATVAVLLRTRVSEPSATTLAGPAAPITPPERATASLSSKTGPMIAPSPTIDAPAAREGTVASTPTIPPRRKAEVAPTPPPKGARSPLEMRLQ